VIGKTVPAKRDYIHPITSVVLLLRESVKTLRLITKGNLFPVPLILAQTDSQGTRTISVREAFATKKELIT
jgi:hypothetical protein